MNFVGYRLPVQLELSVPGVFDAHDAEELIRDFVRRLEDRGGVYLRDTPPEIMYQGFLVDDSGAKFLRADDDPVLDEAGDAADADADDVDDDTDDDDEEEGRDTRQHGREARGY